MERNDYSLPANERIAAPVERNNSLTWLAGLVMIVLGVLFLVGQTLYSGDLFASILLMGFGATFFAVYLTNRKHWWALIPTYILMVTGTFIAIEPMLWGEGDAIYWLVAVGLPFLYLFAITHSDVEVSNFHSSSSFQSGRCTANSPLIWILRQISCRTVQHVETDDV